MTEPDQQLMRGGGVALWRQVEDILRHEILGRDLGDPEKLPTEHELARRFGVNRHTVRQALSALQDKGFIRIEQGRGTFVIGDVLDYPLSARTRFSEILSAQSRAPANRLIRGLDVPAEAAVAQALEVAVGTTVTVLDTVGEADGHRISVSSRYYPAGRFPGLTNVFSVTGSVTAALAHYGLHDYRRRTTRVTAQMPSAEDARYLHIARSRPILVTENVNVDVDGRPIEYGLTRFCSDRVQLIVEFPEGGDGTDQ